MYLFFFDVGFFEVKTFYDPYKYSISFVGTIKYGLNSYYVSTYFRKRLFIIFI